MVEASGADDEYSALDDFAGKVIDDLLTVASEGVPYESASLLEWARRGMRSHRPDVEYVWPEILGHALRESQGQLPDSARSAVSDALAIVDGQLTALAANNRWRLRDRAPRFDARIELAQFRTTNSFREIADRFGQQVGADEPLVLIIRGHLWVEASIIELLGRLMPAFDKLRSARLSFAQTLAICAALNALPDDIIAVARQLNTLRNRLAHDLEFPISSQQQDDLIVKCSARVKHLAFGGSTPDFPDGIAQVIAAVVIYIHGRIDGIDASSRYNEYLHQRVLDVLGRRSD